jgi:hypothetical protein
MKKLLIICLALFGCANYVEFTSNVDSTVSYKGNKCTIPCELDVSGARRSIKLNAVVDGNSVILDIFKADGEIFVYYEAGKVSLYNTDSVFANIKVHYYDYKLELNGDKRPLLKHLSFIAKVKQSEIESMLLALDEETFLAEMLKYEKSKIEYKIYD